MWQGWDPGRWLSAFYFISTCLFARREVGKRGSLTVIYGWCRQHVPNSPSWDPPSFNLLALRFFSFHVTIYFHCILCCLAPLCFAQRFSWRKPSNKRLTGQYNIYNVHRQTCRAAATVPDPAMFPLISSFPDHLAESRAFNYFCSSLAYYIRFDLLALGRQQSSTLTKAETKERRE